jgi:hypothetical protein
MTKERPPDPVDLMLDGNFDEAAKAYVELYVDALKRNDFAIGPDLLMALQYCVAAMAKHAPATREVELAVKAQLTKRDVKIDRHVKDHLQIANSMVEKARQRAERSVAGVESEKQRRWTGK